MKQYTYVRGKLRFLVPLYEMATGDLLAMIEADYMGQLRTGAASGVARNTWRARILALLRLLARAARQERSLKRSLRFENWNPRALMVAMRQSARDFVRRCPNTGLTRETGVESMRTGVGGHRVHKCGMNGVNGPVAGMGFMMGAVLVRAVRTGSMVTGLVSRTVSLQVPLYLVRSELSKDGTTGTEFRTRYIESRKRRVASAYVLRPLRTSFVSIYERSRNSLKSSEGERD